MGAASACGSRPVEHAQFGGDELRMREVQQVGNATDQVFLVLVQLLRQNTRRATAPR